MSSKAERIALALETLFKTPPMNSVAPANVVRDPIYSLPAAVTASLSIDIGNEEEPSIATSEMVVRALHLTLIASAKGNAALNVADALSLEAHQRMWADPGIGALIFELIEGPVERNSEALEKPLAQIARHYRMRYITEKGSLE